MTSRTRLNVRAEWLAPLEGMRVPGDPDHESAKVGEEHEARRSRSDTPEPSRSLAPHEVGGVVGSASLRDFAIQPAILERYSATALFLACVRRVRPDFQPTADDARHIVHICRLLEGYPLAIELAAAWIRTLPLARIAQELEHGLDVLTTTMRDVPARHRSMVAAFDHSWRLLSPREQSLLRQLSVFSGSWTEEAAAAVAGATLAELSDLADTSWLRPTSDRPLRDACADPAVLRARKLETEHESATGESADQVHGRYAAYYRALLLARQGEFYRRPGIIPEMAAEHDNLLAAWNWFAARDDLEAVRTMIPGFFWIAEAQGWERTFKSLLEAYARKLKEGENAWLTIPTRSSEMALVRATVLTVILGELPGLSWEAWQTWVGEAMSLLAQGAADDERWRDERWREVRWTLQFRIAHGTLRRGN